ncbi:MAG: zinc-ribbon domain-containing protein [Erysipelotrichaceae bacterium]|nr:zinc-ribbon domain-containing protein [Erysipelotrichaceae bacterium]
MLYCTKCGKPLEDNANFCMYCGAPVNRANIETKPQAEEPAVSSEKGTENQGIKLVRKKTETEPVTEEKKTVKKTSAKKKTESEASVKLVRNAGKAAQIEEPVKQTPVDTVMSTVQKERKTGRKKETAVVNEDLTVEKETERKLAKEQKKEEKAARKELKKQQKALKKQQKKEQKALRKQQKKEKKKKRGSFLGRLFKKIVLLWIITSIFVVCFISPGLLKDRFDPIVVFNDLVDRFLTEPVADNMPAEVLDEDDPALITIRYSNSELSNAPKSEAEVSPSTPKVSTGGVTVDMGSNNLRADDTLIVRDLGKKEDSDLYLALHCYDLSLKSGQDQFIGNVKVTLPLNLASDEYIDGMVFFNETTKEWEDLYYEVSADGKSITGFMDHFTKVSPKIMKMTSDMFEGALANNSARKHQNIIASDDNDILVPADLFVEAWNKIRETKDTDYLYVQFSPTMRNVGLHNATVKSLFQISGGVLSDHDSDINETIRKLGLAVTSKEIDWPLRILGLADSTNGSIKDLGFLNKIIPNRGMPYTDLLGNMMAGLNITAVALKLYSECKSGKDAEQVAIDNNLAIFSALASGASFMSGAIPALGAWPVTVLAIGIYVISISVDLYRYSEGLDELPLQEQAYLAYYKEKGISFDGKEFICKMEVPTGLDAVKNSDTPKIIKNNVNHTGLNDNNISDWESMLSAIMKNSEQYPTKTKEYLDDLYYKYADAYWQLPEDVRNGWFTQWMMKQGYDDEFIDTMLKQKILKSDIDAWRKDKIDQTLLNFQDQLKNQIDKYATKSYTAFKKAVQKEIINPLNQMIYFLIDDTSLTKEQTFYDSLYCQDYRLIPFNQEAYFKNISFKMDKHPLDSYPLMKKELPIYSDVVTTMRFADVEYPVFYPYQIVVDGGLPYIEKVELTDRYPHTPEYLPFVDMTGYKGYKNMVFVTTLYHYIQMGRPTRMIFRDVNGINTFEDAQKYYDDPGIEASFSIPKFNKNGHSFVKVKVGGDGDLSNLNGYWEGPWLGSSKQWYYFDIDTQGKRIYIDDTLGLPTESYTIRFYKYDTKTRTLKFNIGWGKEKAHLEFKMTGKNTMVLYIEYNGDSTSLEFVRSNRERFDDWSNRQKFYIPDYDAVMPPGEEFPTDLSY